MRWERCVAGPPEQPDRHLPLARMGHVAAAVSAADSVWGEELFLVHGGIGEDKRALRGPDARAFHCAATMGARIYLFGGHVYVKEKKGLHKFDDLWTLDTVRQCMLMVQDSWEWSQVAPAPGARPSARDFARLAALPGGSILLFGGLDASERRLDDAWVFDTASGAWREVNPAGPRPKGRYGHALLPLGPDRAFLFGGETAGGIVNDAWLLKGLSASGAAVPAVAAWEQLEAGGALPAPRKGHAAAMTPEGVVVFGGHTATIGWLRSRTDVYHRDVAVLPHDALSPGTSVGVWKAVSLAPEGLGPVPREYHSLTALSGGRMITFGGGNGKQMFGDAWWLVEEVGVAQGPPPAEAQAPGEPYSGSAGAPQPSAAAPPLAVEAPSPQLPPPSVQSQPLAWWESLASTARAAGGALLPSQAPAQQPFQALHGQPAGAGPAARGQEPGPLSSLDDQASNLSYLWDMDSGAAAAVAAVEAADALERLRESIGLPALSSRTTAVATDRQTDKQLVALGEQLLTSSAPLVPHTQADIIAAARAHLAGREGQDIRLRELPMLLADFKRCLEPSDSGDHLHTMSAAQLAAAMLAQPGQLAEMLTHERTGADQHASAVARFVGAEAASLRLGDIAELQAAYGDVAVAVLS